MRSGYVVVVFICVVASVPTFVSAQSANGSVFGPSHAGDFRLDVGYLGYNSPVAFMSIQQRDWGSSATTMHMVYPVEGVQIRLSAAYPLTDGFHATISGMWLFPNNDSASETIARPSTGRRLWQDTSTQWWTLDGCLGYSLLDEYNIGIVGGFRYDSLDTRFANPTTPYDNGRAALPSDEANLFVRLCIPYVGFVCACGPVKIGFKGCPFLAGNVEYGMTDGFLWTFPPPIPPSQGYYRYGEISGFRRGYFIEASVACDIDMLGRPFSAMGMDLGGEIFCKYTNAHGSGDTDTYYIMPPNPKEITTFSANFHMENFVIGAGIALSFDLPI